jgi:ketosteroid isomerase-like protein
MGDARKLDLGLIREIYDLWNRGDVEATFAYVHPDLEWHTRWFDAHETYRGRDGLRAFFMAIGEAWEDLRVEPERFVSISDERGVVVERLIGRGRGSGIEVDMHVYEVVTTRDGLISKREVFYSLDEALAASHE